MSQLAQLIRPVAGTLRGAVDWAKIGFAVGAIVTAAIAAGQIFALGVSNATQLNWVSWIKGPFIGAGIGAAALLAIFFGGLVLGFLHSLIKGWFGQRGLVWAVRLALVALALAGFLQIARIQQTVVATRYPQLAKPVDAATTVGAVARQERALDQLSAAASGLLTSLTRTEEELAETRHQLTRSLAEIDRQKTAAGRAGVTLASLAEQQRQIELQVSELQRVLGGARPLTRSDLQESQWAGLWQGFMLGVISSVVASYIFTWLDRKNAA
jgi:hypothetical protein